MGQAGGWGVVIEDLKSGGLWSLELTIFPMLWKVMGIHIIMLIFTVL